jgi:hypothetical protein
MGTSVLARWRMFHEIEELAQMALSPHNDPIQSFNQVPIVIIDNSNRELYLLATSAKSEKSILSIISILEVFQTQVRL